MKRLTHKKTAAVAVTAVLALGGGGIAFAYFTSTGSGTGSATVGAPPTDAFDITSSGPAAALLPGNDPQTFVVHVANTSDQSAYVSTVSMSVATFESTGDAATASGADIPGCSASWFTVSTSVDINAVVPALGSVDSASTGVGAATIEMPATDVNQDACHDASVGILFSTTG